MLLRNAFRRLRRQASLVANSNHAQVRTKLSLVTLEQRITPVRIPPAYNVLPANPAPAMWSQLSAVGDAPAGKSSELRLSSFVPYSLSESSMSRLLASAPQETTVAAKDSSTILALPTPYGTIAHFRIVNAEIMEPGLAAQFPEIHTIRGQGIEDPAAVLVADITRLGFHAQVMSPNGWYYIDPYWHLDTSVYAVYSRDAVQAPATPFQEFEVDSEAMKSDGDSDESEDDGGSTALRSSGTTLRTYRLANSANWEYVTFWGGTAAQGQAAVVTAINRVTGIMETELAIRLMLVANNLSLISTNTNDGFSNSPSSMLNQNQTKIDSVIGSANYDIGHVFGTGDGGIASLGVVGFSGQKAKGATGNPAPSGDPFWVDYVIHEMGHQFGANHTFNGVNGSAAGGNRNGPTAYEPGSGSTIMAYAGICGVDDLQAHSDPYYHTQSYDEIRAFVESISAGAITSTGNNIPTVNAGSDYFIPTGTTFALTATGSDPDGDALTYGWEERDLGAAQALSAADNGSSPMFRSFNPTTSPTRTFPKFSSTTLDYTFTSSEKIPVMNRTTSNYRVTVRDNRPGGGGVNQDDMVLRFVNTGAAFTVTNPSGTWTAGENRTINWNVAGTTGSGINAGFVNIRLSTDGGNTFPIMLASSVANDGSETIVVPANATSTARIKVEPTNNVFFDISGVNFSITVPATPPRLVQSVAVNDDTSAQHSMVKSLTITFNGIVIPPMDVASAFTLSRIGGGPVGFTGSSTVNINNLTVVTLTNFTGADVEFNSLMDGTYTLTATASLLTDTLGQALDGDGNGSAGGDYQLNGTRANGLFRLFGDISGDGFVTGPDLGAFRPTIGSQAGDGFYLAAFDFNGDGFITGPDLGAMRTRIGASIP